VFGFNRHHDEGSLEYSLVFVFYGVAFTCSVI
jgi:hypothetical protein